MPKFVLSLTLAAISAFAAFGQQPTPTPTPATDEVVRISTNLIQLDVTVTDRKGNVVRDLKPEDFEVYENGNKEDIFNFSFISSTRTTIAAPEKSAKTQPLLPPAPVRPEQVRRAVALVVDDLTLSYESTRYVRRALKKFVDEQMQEGDLVAIVRTSGGMGALQQFTTDKRQLYAAIERVHWNLVGTGEVGSFAPLEAKPESPVPEESPAPGVRSLEGRMREFKDLRESVFATGTLGAIDYVVRGMKELPGRKSIMLFSDGFKMFTEDALNFRESTRVLDAIRRLVDQANRASVVIYSVDGCGLAYTGLTAADDTDGYTFAQVDKELEKRRQRLFDTQDGLRYLAEQTGGFAVLNTNDPSGGVRKILDDQSYYLLGYVPDDATFDPKTRRFNQIEIKVKRPGLKVRYRSGFYSVAEDKSPASATTAGNRLLEALTSPFAVNQISLHLNALFSSGAQGPFVRSLLHVRAQDITFKELPNGDRQAVFDVLAIGFGDNGVPVDRIRRIYTMTIKMAGYEELLRDGFIYDFSIPVKKPGAYQFRVAIRDHGSEKVGSANQFVEVPNLKKGRLELSGVVLENIPVEEWKRREQGQFGSEGMTALANTSLRQFKHGTVLNYGFTIFNAKPGSLEGGNLVSMLRIYRDGKVVFEGKPQPVSRQESSIKAASLAGSLVLGDSMIPGDYIIQFVVTDKLANEKSNSASQFVQFEIVQ